MYTLKVILTDVVSSIEVNIYGPDSSSNNSVVE